jgi:DNA-binding response OmpR family regulator
MKGGTMAAHVPSVLFVDFNHAWSESVRTRLRDRGIRVMTVDAVGDALEAARHLTPDLIAIDSELAGAPDIGVVAALRSRSPGSKIMLMTPDESPSLEDSCRRLGLAYYGVKSLDPAALTDIFLFAMMPRQGRQTSSPKRRPLVMCVDDDPRQLRSMARTLLAHGCRVCSCETAEQALKLIPEVRPDLAILDIMMPGMDGLDLTQEIKSRFGTPFPVILMTALSSDEAQYEGHERGAKYFISKPADPHHLNDVVDYFAGGLDETRREELKSRL